MTMLEKILLVGLCVMLAAIIVGAAFGLLIAAIFDLHYTVCAVMIVGAMIVLAVWWVTK
ncbi:hypothetical protein SAMN04515656_11219 [Eubacterium aggregans]|uniref:Uncharacterized protein n=1 Tax=Eubacterium aggregans TaxID=81409 RepID=A0A1H4BP33_9FIRM|nr:hypothetical protein [Eubacterium aggregans]SEA49837.1 hypothetical protein SAMN04515656_11219 [Eubacterium aggregans]